MTTETDPTAATQLTAGQRAVLGALVEYPDTTAAGLANAANVSLATARRALRHFEELGVAIRCVYPRLDQRSTPDLWSRAGDALIMITETDDDRHSRHQSAMAPEPQGAVGGRSTARDRLMTVLGIRPGLPIAELSWCTILSRACVTEALDALEHESIARRVPRHGPRGRRLADGWELVPTKTPYGASIPEQL